MIRESQTVIRESLGVESASCSLAICRGRTTNVSVCPAHVLPQDVEETRDEAMGLVDRSLLQVVAEGYRLHDLLLDFARDRIGSKTLQNAISLQTRFLGRLNVVVACVTEAIPSQWSLYSLMALWQALEQVSGDEELCIRTYNQCLLELEERQASEEIRLCVQSVGNLFRAKVGGPVCLANVNVRFQVVKTWMGRWSDEFERAPTYILVVQKTRTRVWGVSFISHPLCVLLLLSLTSLSGQGSLVAAEPKLRKSLSMSRHLYAPSHVRVWKAMQELAGLLSDKVSTCSCVLHMLSCLPRNLAGHDEVCHGPPSL